VLVFAATVASATALLFGLVPALRLAARQPGDALRGAGRGLTSGRSARTARTALVVAEVALSLVLVSQAGLLLESFARLRAQPLGFRVEGVWTVPIRLPRQAPLADAMERLEGIRAQLAAIPGVRAVTFGQTVPMQYVGGGRCCWSTRIDVAGSGTMTRVAIHPVASDWFTVFDARVLAGRVWRAEEVGVQPTPAVINDALAVALFGSADAAVGRTVQLRSLTLRAVGVVATDRHYGPDALQGPAVYVPFASIPFPVQDAHMAVLAPDLGGDLSRTLRQAVWRAEPELPVPLVRTMREWVDHSSGASRFFSFMFSAFGALALLLAAAGLYSTLLYTVGMERRELGIRLALGAARTRIHARVLARGLGMVGVGVAIGRAAAWSAGRLLKSQLFGVQPHDLAALTGAAAVLLVTAAAACWLPARRAASTDPMETLRAE
jgi:predicted permease